jgi:hypothetical protein
MTERRSGQDRRIAHGTRSGYQAGCRRTCCRRANARYQANRRGELCRGKLPLHSRVDARATWRLIRLLLKHGYRKAQIARFLGLKRPILEVHPVTVTRETELRMQGVYADATAEAPDA